MSMTSNMNRPSSTITTAAIAGAIVGVLFILLAAIAPEVYSRVAMYPGAEAHLTTLAIFAAGYFKKENVLPVKT